MKFIKAEEIQKSWFKDEREYEATLQSIRSCLGKNIIFAQVHEDDLKAIIVLDITKVVVIKWLVIYNDELLAPVIRLVKQKYKNKDLVCEVDGLSLEAYDFVGGVYLRKDHVEDAFLNELGLVERYPVKLSEKQVVLNYLFKFFEAGRLYTEREVNDILKAHISFEDYVTIRRDLFDFNYLKRSLDGGTYETNV